MVTKWGYNARLTTEELLLRHRLGLLKTNYDTAIVLGTGWGDSLDVGSNKFIDLADFQGGEFLEKIEGHKRRIEVGTVGGRDVLILRGRVHMNECTFNPDAAIFVRMQIELLIRLGVKNLILTCGSGGLGKDATPGTIVFIDSFVSSNNEVMPLFPGEFVSPEGVLDPDWIDLIDESSYRPSDTLCGPYVFWRGPHIEGIAHDKEDMHQRGGIAVGMSIKPECCVAALYKNVRVLALAHVMNGATEVLDHISHTEKAKANSDRLGQLLTNIVADLPV